MNKYRPSIDKIVFAALTMASTLFLFSCAEEVPKPTIDDPETTPTEISHNHLIINSVDGNRKYRMETPLLERYGLAEEPFMEFVEGIKVETFDSLLNIESKIVADYAHLNETTKLWEARGNVVINNYEGQGRSLETERLYWDQKEQRIYSDTLSKVTDGGSVHVGQNFEADDSFESWSFHKPVGKIEVDAATMQDTTAVVADSLPAAPTADSLRAAPATDTVSSDGDGDGALSDTTHNRATR